MVHIAERTALSAEADQLNAPGYCLQWCREKADIRALYPDASTAWRNTNDRYPGDRKVPRGAMAYWTGGSKGYGHIAVGVGKGLVRSTDANGAGRVATRDLAWFDRHWPSLHYTGWAWDVNEITIPHEEESEMNEQDWQRLKGMLDASVEATVERVWAEKIEVTKPSGDKEKKKAEQVIKETWQKVAKAN